MMKGKPRIGALQDDEACFQIATGVIGILLNILEFFIIRWTRQRRIFESLLLSLSLADLMFCLSATVMGVFQLRHENYKIRHMHILYLFFIVTSFFHIFWITIDRLLTVLSPFKYTIICFGERKTKRIKYMVITSWSLSFIVAFVIYMASRAMNGRKMKNRINYALVTAIILANCFIIFSYAILIFKIMKMRRIATHVESLDKTDGHRVLPRKQVIHVKTQFQIFVLCFLTAISFAVCTLPFAVEMFTTGFRVARFYSRDLLIVNSALNSIIYFVCWKLKNLLLERTAKRRIQPILTNALNVKRLGHQI